MSEHVLVVSYPDGDEDPTYTVECPGATDDCRAWLECQQPGCPPFAPGSAGEEEAEADGDYQAHGVTHRWESNGLGWAPQGWCWIARYEAVSDAAEELFAGSPAAGRYPVRWETDWRGENLTLHLVGEEVADRAA